jgi:hypothetical protein
MVEPRKTRIYSATLGDLALEIRESAGGYIWSVRDSQAGEQIAGGESAVLENAMVSAAHAVQAEWGALRWRSNEPEE